MSKINLLISDAIWLTLPTIIKVSRHVDAAIAYFGHDGAKLLPLRNGDRLVVDMSPATVKAGGTDPREIEKLLRRGVQVFTRRNLHAKIVIADKIVLVGSANISNNSRDILDEAAVLTDDTLIARRAKEFLDRICIEPVGPEYLAECIRIYKPSRLIGNTSIKGKRPPRVSHAKLWLVNLVDYSSLPDSEIEAFEKSEENALTLITDAGQYKLSTFHWPHKPRMADELEIGDWIIQCVKHKDKGISVYPPGHLILVDHYTRNQQGKERYVFHLEYPRRGEDMSWAQFRKTLNSVIDREYSQPRTMAIRDTQKADDLLRLWTPKGRVSRK